MDLICGNAYHLRHFACAKDPRFVVSRNTSNRRSGEYWYWDVAITAQSLRQIKAVRGFFLSSLHHRNIIYVIAESNQARMSIGRRSSIIRWAKKKIRGNSPESSNWRVPTEGGYDFCMYASSRRSPYVRDAMPSALRTKFFYNSILIVQ